MLPDGVQLTVRVATPDDLDAVVELHQRCSLTSRLRRYLAGTRMPSTATLGRLLSPASGHALVVEDGAGRLIAMANLIWPSGAQPSGTGTPEIAILGRTLLSLGRLDEGRLELLQLPSTYPNSPLADDALFAVGQSYEQQAQQLAGITIEKAREESYVMGQRDAYWRFNRSVMANDQRSSELRRELLDKGDDAGLAINEATIASRGGNVTVGQLFCEVTQAELEAEVRHTVQQLADRGVKHAATVVLDNRTGEILAWVGSPDFWADTAGQVDMVVNVRQPGSALKPFLYALGFDRGLTPASVLADISRTYQTSGGPYHPRNYDRIYHGPVRVREALGSSYNVPAVEVADRIGFGTLLHGLHEAGFVSLSRSADFYGLGLALGMET